MNPPRQQFNTYIPNSPNSQTLYSDYGLGNMKQSDTKKSDG